MSRVNLKDNLDYLFERGVDLKNRVIYLHGDIDAESAEQFVKNLDALQDRGDSPVVVKLNSDGGEVGAGFVIYDAIRACDCHVTVICEGEVQSMALIILQAADQRLSRPHTVFMNHQLTDANEGNPRSLKNWAAMAEVVERECCRILGERTKKPAKFWEKSNADQVFTAAKALELGLIDEVLS